jgi:hypothetical protein
MCHSKIDLLSVLVLLLAVATAGVQSTRSLKVAAKRYKTRDATLRRLLDKVEMPGTFYVRLNSCSRLALRVRH